MEGMKAYSDLKRMIEMIPFEQFHESLEGDFEALVVGLIAWRAFRGC
jgi:hypothetical protein